MALNPSEGVSKLYVANELAWWPRCVDSQGFDVMDPMFLFVGRLAVQKGPDLLLEAAWQSGDRRLERGEDRSPFWGMGLGGGWQIPFCLGPEFVVWQTSTRSISGAAEEGQE